MSTLKVSSIIILFSILSCSESNNDGNSSEIADTDDFEKVNYELKDSSIIIMPYSGRTKVTFIDSLSNKLEFKIYENELKTESFSNYNEELGKCEPPSWTEQSKEIILFNDSLDLTFILELKTERDRSVSHNKKFSDKLFLWTVSHPNNDGKDYDLLDNDKILRSRHALFQCIVDPRNSGNISHWTPVDSTLILGHTFYDVLGLNSYGTTNDRSILFNFKYGILAFRDYKSKYWRFSHFNN